MHSWRRRWKKSGSQIRTQGFSFALRVQLWKSAHPSFQPPAESFWACLRAALDPVTNQLPLSCLKLPLKSPEEDEEEKQEVRRLAESKESSASAAVEAVLSELDGFYFHIKRRASGTEGFYLRTTFCFFLLYYQLSLVRFQWNTAVGQWLIANVGPRSDSEPRATATWQKPAVKKI